MESNQEGFYPFKCSKLARLNKAFRPDMPQEVFDCIFKYCSEEQNDFTLALDIGCGTGVSTVPLAKSFQHVIGLDISEAQIFEADTSCSNVSYKVGCGEDLSFCQPESVDLVTFMTSFHWLDSERVYREVKRVLKPDGVIAICSNFYHMDLGHPDATHVLCSEVCFEMLYFSLFNHFTRHT